jgi:crossover junction endodeoxyribonuclease RusA
MTEGEGKFIEFEVVGSPAPQGSKRQFRPGGPMVETSKSLPAWRTALAEAARDVAETEGCIDRPVRLEVEFRFSMPKSRPKRVREAGSCPKVSAPDLDKLVRAVGDGLKQGGLIRDDAIIYSIAASKFEVVGWTGAIIRLEAPT